MLQTGMTQNDALPMLSTSKQKEDEKLNYVTNLIE